MGSSLKRVKKRDGRVVEFVQEKLMNAVYKAAEAVGGRDQLEAKQISEKNQKHKKLKRIKVF